MDFNSYQEKAAETAVFKHVFYPHASLMIEASELADLFCKPVLRGDDKTISRTKVVSEAGDVLWNLAMVLHQEGITLEEVAQYNIDKLQVRKLAGTIKGDGDR